MSIFDGTAEVEPPKVIGSWMPVRLTPDLVTGELFNIGIVFVDSKAVMHSRFVQSIQAFKSIFGERGFGNLHFLLALAREHFESGRMGSPSPHISLGDPKPATGMSPKEIMDHIFSTMVTMVSYEEAGEIYNPSFAFSTTKLRQKVLGRLKTDHAAAFNRLSRAAPVSLTDQDGSRHLVDLPLYDAHDDILDGPIRYGTIVSAQFKNPVHRNYNIGQGTSTIMEAHTLMPKNARPGIFMLRPDENTRGYTKKVLDEIDNDIDRQIWIMKKHVSNAHPEICSTIESLAERIAEFAA